MSLAHQFLFGVYPYIAATIFLLGSLVRFDREQYTWKSDSSQLLRRGQLRLGNTLFHSGVILLFFGHLVGLLTPSEIYHAFGLTAASKQTMAMTAGGVFGTLCFIGLAILLHRRLSEPRIRAVTSRMDVVVLSWILATLGLGLYTIAVSAGHPDGSVMVALAHWAQHVVTFRSDAASFIVDAPLIYKVHLFFGMTLFVLFPFSRLVHVWSGFASVAYLARAYQVVRHR
ncbi:MAG TPA: respiratory nitrate reductase subunit gamma [Steroidobacter sp.]|jgi:nitrate reductase gamma subunit|nr:respiratory nitrate reductase subunit gamma [Steroidobacter sp.]